jgi:NAD(P)-dependent dehydrogenase (short-subunit alcohol dehydrogenase family)
LVAGATRGAGRTIAVELARAGAHVYATGRSSSVSGRSEMDRPETIEGTGELLAAVGDGAAVVVDHTDADAVTRLVERIVAERGRLDILVNDMFGGDRYAEFDKPVWEHDLAGGWRMMEMGVRSHLVTAALAIPAMLQRGDQDPSGLIIEMTDGTHDYNVAYRRGVGLYYDLVKANVERIVIALTAELADRPITVLGVTPGWLRSEAMLDGFGVTEERWRDALERIPDFAISETPTYVARGVAALAADPGNGAFAGDVLSSGQLARRYGVTDVDGSAPDCWAQMAAEAAGEPAAIADFR